MRLFFLTVSPYRFKWDSEDDWRHAGTRLHALEGLFRVEPGSKSPLSKEGVRLVSSYVPPLRERKDDILPLARVLLANVSHRLNRKVLGLSPGVAEKLMRYDWPGNVRKLENAIERAIALTRGSHLEVEDLPDEIRAGPKMLEPNGDSVRPLEEVEKEHILAVLELNRGNQTQTAAQLQIGSATLYRKLKKYGVKSAQRVV